MRYYRDTLDILSVRLGPLEQFNKYQGFFFFPDLRQIIYVFIYLFTIVPLKIQDLSSPTRD